MPRFFAFPGGNRPQLRRRRRRRRTYMPGQLQIDREKAANTHTHEHIVYIYIYIIHKAYIRLMRSYIYNILCVWVYKNEGSVVIGHVSTTGIRDGLKGYYIILY